MMLYRVRWTSTDNKTEDEWCPSTTTATAAQDFYRKAPSTATVTLRRFVLEGTRRTDICKFLNTHTRKD